ncbi:hypothetical protein INS49_002009 [Diaporthe citri]|uniref:uncharacterized protein n=1 Tax=Diaporthe citri TaxID=83186 RepID=UPI001C815B57|nr:uncharacterized protein INS49_002009 [Diaporthe citri]KAG6367814.1 hypothetical protein INS49_002009 [Diaporthe citri]
MGVNPGTGNPNWTSPYPPTRPARLSTSWLHERQFRSLRRDEAGWLYDDSLGLKKYPGHFTDLIQREAVRLGVQFQIGGKWCSFVAVETNRDDDDMSLCAEGRGTGVARDAKARFLRNENLFLCTSASCSFRDDEPSTFYTYILFHNLSGDPDAISPTHSSPLHDVTLLQTFIRSWALNPEFLGALGLDKSPLDDLGLESNTRFAEAVGFAGLCSNLDGVATILALAFLRLKGPAERDVWDLVADKAMAWLNGQVTQHGDGLERVEKAIEAAEGLF